MLFSCIHSSSFTSVNYVSVHCMLFTEYFSISILPCFSTASQFSFDMAIVSCSSVDNREGLRYLSVTGGASIPKCVVLVNEELHALADFLSFLLGAYCRAVQCSIVLEGLLHLPKVCLPETPAVLRILLAVASGSCSREARCLDELLELAAYDFREGVVETP